jgi:hypothetical protein
VTRKNFNLVLFSKLSTIYPVRQLKKKESNVNQYSETFFTFDNLNGPYESPTFMIKTSSTGYCILIESKADLKPSTNINLMKMIGLVSMILYAGNLFGIFSIIENTLSGDASMII